MAKTITQNIGLIFIFWGIYLLFIAKDTTNGLLSMILGELMIMSCRTYKINK